MIAPEYLQTAVKKLHNNLREAIKDLNDAQLHFRPLDQGNHIAFIVWHCVRTEDSVINFFWQKKKPVWTAEGWDKKFGMDPKAQGTGMTAEQAASLRIADWAGFGNYMEKVFQETESFLASLKEEDLAEVRDLPHLGKRSLLQLIGGIVLEHGSGHLGEIWYVKGLLGLKGSPI
jgi:hypothetical protein